MAFVLKAKQRMSKYFQREGSDKPTSEQMQILGVGAVDYLDPHLGQHFSREMGIYVVDIENGERTPAFIYPDHVYGLEHGKEGLYTIATMLSVAMEQMTVPFGLKGVIYDALAVKTLDYVKSLPSRVREIFLVYRESW